MQGAGQGRPLWLQLRPAVPHQFSGNNLSQGGLNTERQRVSGWAAPCAASTSPYVPLRRRRAPGSETPAAVCPQVVVSQEPRSTLSQPQLRLCREGLLPGPQARASPACPQPSCNESSKLNPKPPVRGLKPTQPRPLIAGNAVLCSQRPLWPHAHTPVLPLPLQASELVQRKTPGREGPQEHRNVGPSSLGLAGLQKVSAA